MGGAAFREAPPLESGLYTDTILANESLWYAVELQENQELVVRATLDRLMQGREVGALFEVQIVSPDLEDLCCGDARGYHINLENRVVSAGARSGIIGSDESLPAGTYYIRATCEKCAQHTREQPLELGVEVLGAEAPSPASTPTVS